MSMRIPYKDFPVRNPIPSLGGRMERPRPVIFITMLGPLGTYVEGALLDTGADDTLFPETVAGKLGIDLANAPIATGAGFGMLVSTVRYAEVTLRITDGVEQREWKAWVGFTSAKLRQPLLGYAGFLQFFTATFRGDLQEVELEINSSYPGS